MTDRRHWTTRHTCKHPKQTYHYLLGTVGLLKKSIDSIIYYQLCGLTSSMEACFR